MRPALRPGMPHMEVRLIDEFDGLRLQYRQPGLQQRGEIAAHAGSTFLKGLTTTFS